MDTNWQKLCKMASVEVEGVLNDLPKELREQVRQLPITFEHKPNEGLQEEGIEADTLGVFTGAEFAEKGRIPMPPQIILFLENIWDMAEGNSDDFFARAGTFFWAR
jgi:predicted Zn-dependent protease with MMP-like domain